jgi:SAM-dependent methyltransferase
MHKLFEYIADNRNQNSLAGRMRRKRMALLKSLLASLEKPVRMLDIGGTEEYWKVSGLVDEERVNIVLLNLRAAPASLPNCVNIVGDARQTGFEDDSFDVVFSNSVIEHVGDYSDQTRMAEEIRRVGKRYFVQTPNRYFPIEPHFLFPFFQFFPLWMKTWLLMNFNLGWFRKIPDRENARQAVESIRLLDVGEFSRLFPGAKIYREGFFGLTKSLIAYEGWHV